MFCFVLFCLYCVLWCYWLTCVVCVVCVVCLLVGCVCFVLGVLDGLWLCCLFSVGGYLLVVYIVLGVVIGG